MTIRPDEQLENADWTKQTFDILGFASADEMRAWIEASGLTVEEFKRLPAFRAAVASARAPEWLTDL